MTVNAQKSVKTPKLRHHKATGQAYVVLNGKVIYFGPYGIYMLKKFDLNLDGDGLVLIDLRFKKKRNTVSECVL